MEANSKLHHCTQNIAAGSLENILDMYTIFNCEVKYRPESKYKWAMVGQTELRFSIQIIEVSDQIISNIEIKRQTHIAFISDNPQELVDKVEQWANSKGIRFIQGGWSEKERYFDLPDLFVNSVVEIMDSSIIKK
ncbi:MAG: hypothetical protein WCK91_00865 [bacterium]